ncbi:MAG: hypothetical protein WBD46_18540 [Acidobacteriaceae bacterium]
MNDLAGAVEQLTRNVADLQSRVSALEGASPVQQRAAVAAAQAEPARESQALSPGGGAFLVLGKAMLAIAGAYLLRGLAESSAVPRTPVIVLSLAYAFVWLIPATRAAAKGWFASAVWAATSVLILIPMLWELTLRFRFLPDAITAAVLGGFVLAATGLGWKHHFAEVGWVADASGSLTAMVLAIAARDLAPFIAALLAMALVGEIAAARNRTLRVRPLVAAAADFAIFALIWIESSPSRAHAEYAPVGTAALLLFGPVLLLIYAGSAATQTILLRRRISFFETAQTLVAFLLSAWGVFAFGSGERMLLLWILCLAGAAAGYAVTFAWFSRAPTQRNYHVYATGSLALLLAGCFLCLPRADAALVLGLFAVPAVLFGGRGGRLTPAFHGLAALAVAAFFSGWLAWAARVLTGTHPAAPGWMVVLVCASSVVCYFAVWPSPRRRVDGSEGPSPQEAWRLVLRLATGAIAAGTTAALLVWVLVRLTSMAVVPGASHLAVIRTLVLCAMALGLAWSGAFWQRKELMWLAWATLAFGASKLLFEDLRHGRLTFTAASLFLYAFTLLAVPRLMHHKQRAQSG